MDIEEIFCRYQDDVYRLALSYTRSVQEAEDVCQNVFVKLMEHTVSPGKEKAWLMRVTANQCRNLLRSAWWKKTAPLEDTNAMPAQESNGLYQRVMALPPKYRVVIYLRYYEELTTKEMAALLHISRSNVTTRLNRARQMLKEMLEGETV